MKDFKVLLGRNKNKEIYIDLSNPLYQNVLINGSVGSGKTTIINNFILYWLSKYKRSEVELKIINLFPYNEFPEYKDCGIQIETVMPDEERALKTSIMNLHYIVTQRLEYMKNKGWLGYWRKPEEDELSRMVVFITGLDGIFRAIGKDQDKYVMLEQLTDILRYGSAVGVHIIVDCQIIPFEMRQMLPFIRKRIFLRGNYDRDTELVRSSGNTMLYDFLCKNRHDLRMGESIFYDEDISLVEKVWFLYFNLEERVLLINEEQREVLFDMMVKKKLHSLLV